MTERAIVTAIVYFGTFLLIGWAGKKALDHWMNRKGVSLNDAQDAAGGNRGAREVFLLGIWRKER